jgi:uncharacterized repeat protein (TIGR03803 family)
MSIASRLVIGTLAAVALPITASAGTLTTLYTFQGGTDGGNPTGPLIDENGALYGIAPYLSESMPGNVYRIDLKSGAFAVVHTFQGGSDGMAPAGGLVDVSGTLYGTTAEGGGTGCLINGKTSGCGTIFSINAKTGAENVVYALPENADGNLSEPGSPVYSSGTVYAPTAYGGANGKGSVFSYNLATDSFTVLHSFGSGMDGVYANLELLYQGGLLYGTTTNGGGGTCHGGGGCGTLFSINPTSGNESILTNFSKRSLGWAPNSNLVYNAGSLIGDAVSGGTRDCQYGCGVLFSVNTSTDVESALHYYDNKSLNPGGLTIVGANAYATSGGDDGSWGELVKINLKSGHQTVLYSFTGGSDGGHPTAPLIYRKGAFYGITNVGGGGGCGQGCGTVFKYVP